MSKGLKALESLVETMPFALIETNSMKYVKIIEKELKALEIIKNKKVNVSLLSCSEWLDFYNQEIAYKEKELTKEEYDLLKEVML